MTKSWDIKRIYFYLVCLVTLIMVIVGTVQLFQSLVDVFYPEPGYYMGYYEKIRPDLEKSGLTEEQLKEEAEKQEKLERERQKHWQVKRLVNSLALIIVALPIYLYHWRKVQRLEI